MNRIVRVLRGEARIRVTGAAPQEVLNLLTRANIVFWDIVREDELNYSFSVFPKNEKSVKALALRAYCNAELLWINGLKEQWGKLKQRPVLIIGLLLALASSFFLQSFVWVIQVKGTDRLHEQEILRALEEEGISFGTWGASIDSQEIRLKMLSQLPQISWLAVNRKGGKLTVLLTEKEERGSDAKHSPGNLVALREGVITDFTVSEGMRLCTRGETVKEGQLLVSGLEDYGIYLKAVRAQGEIYAQTWHVGSIVRPATKSVKEYTDRQWTQISLLLGNKRINLYGNSGIFHMSCDKMISTEKLTIPGYTFPLTLERVTYREYRLREQPVEETGMEEELLSAWERGIQEQMIAGKIVNTSFALERSHKLYVLRAESTCNEMIAKWMPLQQIYEGEDYDRTNHQR